MIQFGDGKVHIIFLVSAFGKYIGKFTTERALKLLMSYL